MSEKQSYQLKQFKIFSYDDWAKQATTYIPSLGEICGIIVHNNDEKVYFPLPDGYELVQPPFTLLKMGDGETTMAKLPWVTATESEIVTNVLNRIVRNMEVQGEPIPLLEMVQSYIKENTADWLETDPLSEKYIKNKICSFNHNSLEEPVTIIDNLSLSLPNSSNKYINIQFTQDDIKLDKDDLQPYSLYTISLKNNHTENIFLKQVLKTQQSADVRYLYIGNPNLIEESQENTQEKYCIVFEYLTSEENKYNIHCVFSKDFFEINENLNLLELQLNLELTHQTDSISTIDKIWLPEEITAIPDWHANSGENGYILNKICQIDSYKNLKRFLSEIQICRNNEYMGVGKIISEDFITQLLKLNYYSLYENNQKISETRPAIYSLDEGKTYEYILGNPYLFWQFEASNYLNSGLIVPIEIQKFLNLYPDNKTDIALKISKTNSKDYWTISYLKRWSKFNELKNNTYLYVPEINYTINTTTSIIGSGNHKQILNDKEIKYMLLDNNILEITSIEYDINSNSTIIGFKQEIEETYLNRDISPKFYSKDSLKNLSIYLTQEPDSITTIDPIWLPDDAMVGAYGDNGKESKAEIFNDLENNQATGYCSHAEGINTIALGDGQHVQGKYNKVDNNQKYSFIIGNGVDETNRSNAYALDWQGNSEQSGNVQANDFITPNGEKMSTKENIANKVSTIDKNNLNNVDYPTTQAVHDYLQSILKLTFTQNGDIILNIDAVDGNSSYDNEEEITIVNGNRIWNNPYIIL